MKTLKLPESGVTKLKLNVTNIKSVLIRSNKKLRNVEKQKSYLISRQEEQEKRILLLQYLMRN